MKIPPLGFGAWSSLLSMIESEKRHPRLFDYENSHINVIIKKLHFYVIFDVNIPISQFNQEVISKLLDGPLLPPCNHFYKVT
jgi:hypothetical protein